MVAEPFSADQAERHDEMAEYMLRVGEQPAELLIEERSPLSIADKNKIETIEEQASRLDGSCATQAPDWNELRGLGDEDLMTTRDIDKSLNDFDELTPKWLNFIKDVVDSEGVPLARRVFVMDDCDELTTEGLNCIAGTVDSEDFPLNIYCRTLLQNKILRVIKKKYVTKYLEMLAEIAEQKDDYKMFHEQFVKCVKLGIYEDSTVGVKTAEVLRFNTSKSGGGQINFEGYADRMKDGQHDIRHITDESIAVVSSSSFLKNLRRSGYEVPYVADPMDEYAVHQPKEFGGQMLKSTTKEELDLGDEDKKKTLEELKAEFEPLAELTKEVLGDGTVDSLRVLTTSEHGLSVDVERVMKAQVQLDSGSQRTHFASGSQQEREGREEMSEKGEGGEWETVMGKRRKKEESDQERRKKGKEREAEKGGSEQVEKDVTDWTVQIYVKVNGGKLVPMELDLRDDKVEDVVRQIPSSEDMYVTMQGRVL